MSNFLRRFRRLNKAYANFSGYFWIACPICQEMFGGHETSDYGLNYGEPEYIPVMISVDGVPVGYDKVTMHRSKCVCWQCGDVARLMNYETTGIWEFGLKDATCHKCSRRLSEWDSPALCVPDAEGRDVYTCKRCLP